MEKRRRISNEVKEKKVTKMRKREKERKNEIKTREHDIERAQMKLTQIEKG